MSSVLELHTQDRVPILGALRQDSVEYLVRHTTPLRIAGGQTVFIEGAPGECLFIIEEGYIEISHHSADQHQRVAVFGPGDCFGEMALIDCQPRSATAIALDDAKLCTISSNTLFEFYRYDVEQFAVLQMNISREVIRRLRQAGSKPAMETPRARAANEGSG